MSGAGGQNLLTQERWRTYQMLRATVYSSALRRSSIGASDSQGRRDEVNCTVSAD